MAWAQATWAERLYPPVYLIARRAAGDLEMRGYAVPKGSEIVAWVYHTHRDPRWYPEPEVFRPERFTPEHDAKLPKLAYAPFGGGPRACIGKSFAMMESRLLLATIARRFRLEVVAGHRVAIKPRVTLNPKYGPDAVPSRRSSTYGGGTPLGVELRRRTSSERDDSGARKTCARWYAARRSRFGRRRVRRGELPLRGGARVARERDGAAELWADEASELRARVFERTGGEWTSMGLLGGAETGWGGALAIDASGG